MPGLSCSMWTLSYSMWHLVSWPRIEPGAPALGVWSLSHWTPREVLLVFNLGDCLVSVWIFHNNDIFEEFSPVVLKNVPQFGFVCLFFMTRFRANMFDYLVGDGMSFSVQNVSGNMLRGCVTFWLSWVQIGAAYFASWASESFRWFS